MTYDHGKGSRSHCEMPAYQESVLPHDKTWQYLFFSFDSKSQGNKNNK